MRYLWVPASRALTTGHGKLHARKKERKQFQLPIPSLHRLTGRPQSYISALSFLKPKLANSYGAVTQVTMLQRNASSVCKLQMSWMHQTTKSVQSIAGVERATVTRWTASSRRAAEVCLIDTKLVTSAPSRRVAATSSRHRNGV